MDPRHPSKHGNRTIETADPADVDRLRAEQAHQMDESGGTLTTPTLPRQMVSGMVTGTAIGAVLGALLLTPLALAPILELGIMTKLIIVWVAGAAAGATIGAVFLAGARAEATNPENEDYVYADGAGSDRQSGPGGVS